MPPPCAAHPCARANGVPPCDASGNCDTFESAYSNAGRNLFRGPWQWRFDFSVGKDFQLSERFHLRYDAQFFNLFNNPSFDTPNNNVSYYNGNNPPTLNNSPPGSLGIIQYTTGSPRVIQMVLHLTF